MCRLFGLIANKKVDLQFSLREGPRTLSDLGTLNPDGWGVGWYENHTSKVVKEPIPMPNSNQLPCRVAELQSRIAIGHVRKATTGPSRRENCHPFSHERWLFAHNGSVGRGKLYALLEKNRRNLLEGDTDSEVYFHWILQCIGDTEEPISAIRRALGEVVKANPSGMNFLLSDRRRLYACRYALGKYDYYSLYYLERPPSEAGTWTARSRKVDALLKSKRIRGERAVLICSEKLTDEPWREVPPGHVLSVDAQLETKLYKVG